MRDIICNYEGIFRKIFYYFETRYIKFFLVQPIKQLHLLYTLPVVSYLFYRFRKQYITCTLHLSATQALPNLLIETPYVLM